MSIGNSKTLEDSVEGTCVLLPESESKNARILTPNSSESSLARLENLVRKLENITEKLASTSFPDSYEEFGKYVASLLRGLPEKDINYIKATIVNCVVKALSVNENQSTSSLNPSENDSDKIQNNISRGFKRKISVIPSLALSKPNSSEGDPSSLELLKGETNIARKKQLFDSDCYNDCTKNNDLTSTQENTSSLFINNNSHTCSVKLIPFRNSTRKKLVSLETIEDTTAKTDKSLALSTGFLPCSLKSVNSYDFADDEDSNTNISEQSKKETFLSDNSLLSTSDPEYPFEHLDIGYKCGYSKTFKPPLRTYNTFKKKRTKTLCALNALPSTSAENNRPTFTLQPSMNEDTHGSIKLTSTPAENNTNVTLNPSINEDRPGSIKLTNPTAKNNTTTAEAQPKKNTVIHSISASHQEISHFLDSSPTRGPENCLLDIESVGVCEKNSHDEHSLSNDLLTEEMEFKCEEEDISEPIPSDSIFSDEVAVKCEENTGESNPCNDSLPANEEPKEENIFDSIYCGDTNLEIKEEITNETEFDRDVSSSPAADLSDAEDGLKVFTCCHCTQIFFDHNHLLAHNTTEHQKNMPSGIKCERKKKKLWSTSQMAAAILAVRENVMGHRRAAKEFQVPKASLFRLAKLKEPDAEIAASTSLGRKPVFSKSMEQDLVKYMIEKRTFYKTLTKKVICTLAFQFAVKNNLAHRFGSNKMAGTHWYRNFMKRNRDKLFNQKFTGT